MIWNPAILLALITAGGVQAEKQISRRVRTGTVDLGKSGKGSKGGQVRAFVRTFRCILSL